MITPDQLFTWPVYFLVLVIVSVGVGVSLELEQHDPSASDIRQRLTDWIGGSLVPAMFLFIPLGILFVVLPAFLSEEVRSDLDVQFDRSDSYRLSDDDLCVVQNAQLRPTSRSELDFWIDRRNSGQSFDYEPLTEEEAVAIAQVLEAERKEAEQFQVEDAIYRDAIAECMDVRIDRNLARLDGRPTSMTVWVWQSDPYLDLREVK